LLHALKESASSNTKALDLNLRLSLSVISFNLIAFSYLEKEELIEQY
tara:strand:- start:42 stop:182 length:141 start_codon:yes stop_codon:yes gene_type:complete